MIFQVNDILRRVRVCLDQNAGDEALTALGDTDALTLDEIIRSKIVEAVRRVHMAAPVTILESGHLIGDAVSWGAMGDGCILLPDDFMRLIKFRMSDWERPVYAAIEAADPAYSRLHSRYKGLRGSPQKPMCAIGMRPEGKVLEFFCCNDSTAYVSEGLYMPYPRIDDDGGIDIAERCLEAVIYTAAALTLATYGDAQKCGNMLELAKSLMQ